MAAEQGKVRKIPRELAEDLRHMMGIETPEENITDDPLESRGFVQRRFVYGSRVERAFAPYNAPGICSFCGRLQCMGCVK